MAWYRSGTISLTNGSAAVTGAGTAWILNASVGEALLAPDGKLYEISAIASDTSITLATAYLGATQAGQAYVLVPTQSYIRDLAAQAAALVNTYSSIANNAGAGKFGDGTVAAPGVTFAGDQDTGFYRSANNEVTFVANGVAQFKYSATGGITFLNSTVTINGTALVKTDDARLSDARPASDVSAWAKAATKPSYTKSEVGLSNVDNTSDANKPVSTAQQAALNLKLNSAEVSSLPSPSAIPRAGADGKIDPSWIRQATNDIGTPGLQGFGVGICPAPPAGMSRLVGTLDVASDNYGNYQYSDGSVMCWVPAFFYKWGSGANGLALNEVSIRPRHAFATVTDANAAGWALHRAFYDGGVEQPGVFVDKYQCSNNGGTASSIQNGNPLSSAADHNPFSGLTGAPTNAYHGAIVAAKTRGAAFFCNSRFIFAALAMLSYAHGRASASTTYCAWWHATNNFPKGNNNNALRDANDNSVLYVSDGYSNCGKTGSANLFARTTHNGQACGVADLNGNMWEITPGLTSNSTNLYVLKETKRMRDLTSGASLATDLWGATGIAENYNDLGTSYEAWRETGADRQVAYGSASQVFSAATSGNAWNWAGAGGMLAAGDGGTNAFGNDGFWDYKPADMCPISGGSWGDSSLAGVWALHCDIVRGNSYGDVGFRAALYL